MSKDEKPYTINGEPVTPWELIDRAKELGYESEWVFSCTSHAAAYLRARGFLLGYNTEEALK